MNKDLSEILLNPKKNQKGNHYISDCPVCGKERHMYINIKKVFQKFDTGYVKSWDCKRCGETGDIVKLLRLLDKLDWLEGEYIETAEVKKVINRGDPELDEEVDLLLPNKRLPIGYTRMSFDPYLQSRGFSDEHFRLYNCGRTKRLFKYKHFVIVSLEENNECKGFVSRCVLTNEEREKKGLLRWKNSKNTEFSKIVGGYDELVFGVKTAIVVEGIFDKVAVDNVYNLLYDTEIKCVWTFGKNISKTQVYKLKQKGIENLIIIQDPDAVNDSKKFASILNSEFNSVLLGFTGERDLGDSTEKEIDFVFQNLETPEEFKLNKVLKKKLL